jgi:hypothetical protein
MTKVAQGAAYLKSVRSSALGRCWTGICPQAAEQAHQARNAVTEVVRAAAIAEQLKREGKPGAPVCFTVVAFLGGALATFGASFFW